jgi:hypothetical protein
VPVAWEFRGTVLVITTTDRYRRDELRGAADQALADPRFVPGTPVLFDGRLSNAQLSKEDIDWRVGWAVSLRGRGASSRFAIIVGGQPHRYGLGRMLSALLESKGVDLRLFNEIDEALSWLTR